MASPRPNLPVRHMIVALLVVIVPLLLVNWFFTLLPKPEAKAVPYERLFEIARKDASYEVLAPANLPDGWTCVRARWTPSGEPGLGGLPAPGDTWQLGFLTPDRMYISLDQRDAAPRGFVTEVTQAGIRDGSSTVGGAQWERYVTEGGRTRSLALVASDHATIVSGDLPYEALEAFASTLQG